MSDFKKYESLGAYHWHQTKRSFQNKDFNAALLGRYDAVMRFVPRDVESVLDVGCGDGYLLGRLAERTKGIVAGVDDNAKALDLAQQELAARYPNRSISVHNASAYQLPFPDSSFAVVVCADVIEHLKEPRVALKEIERVLIPGGKIIVSTPHARVGMQWDKCHVTEYRADEFRSMMEEVYAAATLFGAWPLRIFDVWKKNERMKRWIDMCAMYGMNVFSFVRRSNLSLFGQLIAVAYRKGKQ